MDILTAAKLVGVDPEAYRANPEAFINAARLLVKQALGAAHPSSTKIVHALKFKRRDLAEIERTIKF